ncbi:hypothetical protein ACE6H2_021244 [Prunus campanulata]
MCYCVIIKVEPKDLSSYPQPSDYTSPVHRIMVKAFEKIKNADFIPCNTVQELEYETVSALQEKQQIYSIGPIFPTGFTKNRVATSLWSESDCIKRLSTRPRGSILYVSSGGYAHADKREIEEIANGLFLSEGLPLLQTPNQYLWPPDLPMASSHPPSPSNPDPNPSAYRSIYHKPPSPPSPSNPQSKSIRLQISGRTASLSFKLDRGGGGGGRLRFSR